jgi:L-fuculose-phosphate aldolase
MDEMAPDDLCGIELKTGRRFQGKNRPAPGANMHLAIYRARPDVAAIFHTHSAWVIGVISAGKNFGPMFAEFVNDLGRTGSFPYLSPATPDLAVRVAQSAKNHDTIFMLNHGMLAMGVNLKQAFSRCVVAEDAAKSLVSASIIGRPLFLTQRQVNKILSLDAIKHRTKMMENK